ncbi:MAG: endonuclease/exonuclease/phosphatase family protein [Myxococcales bacterium]|nr:endonuclease/exonuclease/phosphatase family protein [Myxococcales bacterium]
MSASTKGAGPGQWRFATYNILTGGLDADGGERFDALLRVLTGLRPDLLVLNECNGFDTSGGARLQRLAHELGMTARLATAASGYHVALFFRRAQLRSWQAFDAGFCHAAIRAEFDIAGGSVHVVGAHLDPFSAESRLQEVRLLLASMAERSPVVLMGDLNAISPADSERHDPATWPERYRDRHAAHGGAPDTRAIAALEAAGLVDLAAAAAVGSPAATRPTRLYHKRDVPRQRLDYIFASSDLAGLTSRVRVVDDGHAQLASDHLPVFADIALDARQPPGWHVASA